MATEYVCSGCGHTFRSAGDPADGCPACGADRARLWSVGARDAVVGTRAARPAPAAPPAVEPQAIGGAYAHRPKRRGWTVAWPSFGWRLPGVGLRRPARHRPFGRPARPSRRALLLALVLALWPFPLDDDRLPTPGPARTATGAAMPVPAGPAAGSASLAEMLRPGIATAPGAPEPPAATVGARLPAAAPPALPAAGPGTPDPAPVSRPGRQPASSAEQATAVGGPVAAAAGAPGPTARVGNVVWPGAGDSRDPPASTVVAAPPACVAADVRRLVFLIDVSVSMGLPHGTTPEIENALDDAVHRGDAEALARYRALLADAGAGSRLGLARDAFAQALEVTPGGVEVGVVSFHGCRDIRRLESVARPGFAALLAGVGDLTWHRGGETALSEALREAYAMAGDGAGRIAVITDGKDTCGPPPCEVVEGLRRGNPGIRIDVVDVSGRSDAACLAAATGGSFRVAPLSGSVEDFVSSVRALGHACPAAR